jgi:outer membrane protein
MKNSLKFLALATFFVAFSFTSQAQSTQKIGYIDFNSLLQEMPGIDTVKTALEKYQEALTGQLDQMRLEFENKYLDYQANQASMSGIIKENKEKELTDLQSRIDAFQVKAQQDLQTKQQTLLEPIISKAKQAIGDVAKEMNYTLVLNAIEDVVLYSVPADNLLPQVKKKLGME